MRNVNTVKRRQLLHQIAQEEIKAFITENALKPGDPLPTEAVLVEQLGISRTSVREAVKALEALGILEARVGAGLFVRSFSFDPIFDNLAYGLHFEIKKLSDVLEARYHLEYGMVPRVIEAQTPEQLRHLHAALAKMREVADSGGYSPEYDEAFHRTLYENVGNSVVLKILEVFWTIYRQAQDKVSMPPPMDPIATYTRHADLVESLEARDIPAMQAAMARHRLGVDARVRMLEAAQNHHPAAIAEKAP